MLFRGDVSRESSYHPIHHAIASRARLSVYKTGTPAAFGALYIFLYKVTCVTG